MSEMCGMPSLDGSWGRIQTFSKGRVVREAVFGLCTGARLRVCKLYAVWCTHVRLRRPLVRVVALHGRGVAPGSERTQSHEELPPPDPLQKSRISKSTVLGLR